MAWRSSSMSREISSGEAPSFSACSSASRALARRCSASESSPSSMARAIVQR